MIINHKSPTARARINAERNAELVQGFYWKEKDTTFDTDADSIRLITSRIGKIQALSLLGTTEGTLVWLSSDNKECVFTYKEFLRFGIALDEWIEGKYIHSWCKKASL